MIERIPMKKSKHAKVRCQQRGIKSEHVELLLKYGKLKEKDGAYECSLPRQLFSEICYHLKQEIHNLDKISKSNKTLIFKSDTIITAYNKI